MFRMIRFAVPLLGSFLLSGAALAAASQQDFDTAFAAANAKAKEAAAAKNVWPQTGAALAGAEKAAQAKKWDQAVDLAKQAEALAEASLYQTHSEAKLWKDAEIR